MTRLALNEQTLEVLKNDYVLQANIANVLDCSLSSIPRMINNNSIKLTTASVMVLLRKELKKKDNELLEEVVVKEPALS